MGNYPKSYLEFTNLIREIGNLNKLTYHLPLNSNRLINFQMKIILMRKLISSWLLGICLKHSQTTNLLICIQFGAYKLILASVKQHFDPISQRRKIRLKMNLKPLYAHKSFDSQKFPCFQIII